jgi:hypothetical protein
MAGTISLANARFMYYNRESSLHLSAVDKLWTIRFAYYMYHSANVQRLFCWWTIFQKLSDILHRFVVCEFSLVKHMLIMC